MTWSLKILEVVLRKRRWHGSSLASVDSEGVEQGKSFFNVEDDVIGSSGDDDGACGYRQRSLNFTNTLCC